jgi:Rad3-related DNA helicase
MKVSPRDFGVPHDEWREAQWDAFQRFNSIATRQGTLITQLATGSGKSVLPTAMGHYQNVLVLVHTLGLLDQYEQRYGFSIIKGRQEYPCVLENKVDTWKRKMKREPTAADCHFEQMHKCPVSKKCPYLIAKDKALKAQRTACTYRYASVSKAMQERDGCIVLDEAHDAAEEMIAFNNFDVKYKSIDYWDLKRFPLSSYGEENGGNILSEEDALVVKNWLYSCLEIFAPHIGQKDVTGSQAQKSLRKFLRMYEKIETGHWFLQIFDNRISIRTLDAQETARAIFNNKTTKLLMSATIGNPEPLTKALGIKEYEFESYSHPIPAQYRQITDMQFDKMIKRNLDVDGLLYHKQAIEITKWVRQFPDEWRGIMLTSSYKKIIALHENLKIVFPERRFIVQLPGEKVGGLVSRFINDFKPRDILIGTVQGMGSGLDLYGNLARWAVVAGVPFTNPRDAYSKARRKAYGGIEYQHWNTYVSVVQACGRVSRGEKDEQGNWLPNYALLADGSAVTQTALKYYPDWFKEAME